MTKKKPNKQHDARAASFRRIAKSLRVRATAFDGTNPSAALLLRQIAAEFSDETKILRGMR